MKIVTLFLIVVFGQESSANLQETIASLSRYTNAHGPLYENGSVTQTTRINPVRNCTVKVERRYLRSKGPDSIKRETAYLELGAFDPHVRVQITRTGNPSFQATIERPDGADRIESDMEMNNGSKVKSRESNEGICMDSEESVNRVAHDLSRAIELCGGKAAPS